ncbi:hypothetical protein BOX15_Mlig011734g1 [Macrostomum lignano]|nr:hypothetical protein BOX15_Mlig011734g1 [Macrostomum lignano]
MATADPAATSPLTLPDVRGLCQEVAGVRLLLLRLRRQLLDEAAADENEKDVDAAKVCGDVCEACGSSPGLVAGLRSEVAELRLRLAMLQPDANGDEIGCDEIGLLSELG